MRCERVLGTILTSGDDDYTSLGRRIAKPHLCNVDITVGGAKSMDFSGVLRRNMEIVQQSIF